MADDHIVISSGHSLTPEEVATRAFSSSFRGYDQAEVRLFLKRLSGELAASADNERQLRQSLDEARDRAAHPELDERALTSALGEQTTRILQSAREAAADIRNKAEENASRTVREAEEEAGRLRAEAEAVLNERIEEANRLAAGIREATMEECAALRERASSESASEIETARATGKEMVGEAQAVRERLLGDLARRRRLAHVQIEQLRAGRERLLEAYRVVRRTLDEATEELTVAEAEARLAAEAAARRSAAEQPELSAEDIEAELTGAQAPPPGADVAEIAPDVEAEATAEATTEADTEAPVAETAAVAEPPAAERAIDLSRSERRSSGLRILGRRRHTAAEDDGAVLVEVERQSDIEGVRVLTGDTARAPDAPSVDEIFSRIRADREAAVNRVQEAPPGTADAPADDEVSAEGASHEGSERNGAAADPASSDADETVLQRRDEVLEPLGAQLVRQLKRALQDEQNEVLDRLRTARGAPQADAVLLSVGDQARRYRDVAEPLLARAAEAGARSATGGNGQSQPSDVSVTDLAVDLASDLVGPLRDRLERAFDDGVGNNDAIVERLGAGYRQWKAERIEPVTRHHLAAAFSLGSYAATPDDTELRWLVDDDEGACPDCDDNALAGPTAKGTAFPTGQAHPPAHAGCRCLLVPST